MASSEHVLVNTKNGMVRGQTRKTVEDISFVSFHGIPYGKPPIGSLRFKAPQPVDNWTGIFDATGRSNTAPQISLSALAYNPLSNEDCLQLNVYTPSVAPTSLHPVMVWIHGGGFMMGSTDEALYGPDFLLRKDIVLVTISYRLGPLGFLSVPDPKYEIPGNAGLKDQTLGLRWVQKNIDRFGGDPMNVTLFGESAGATSVHYHLLSDYSKGLFHRAIMQSGTAFSPYAYQSNKDLNSLLAKGLGWDGEGGLDALMKCILEADIKAITLGQIACTAGGKTAGPRPPFVPCQELYGDDTSAFFRQPHHQLISTAWGNSIPLIIGCNSNEGPMFVAEMFGTKPSSDDDSIFSTFSPRELNLDPESPKSLSIGKAIKQFYYGDEKPSEENISIAADIQADCNFWHSTIGVVRSRARIAGGAPTYLYRFSFDSQVAEFKNGEFIVGLKNKPGCVHAEDLVYLFRQRNVYEGYELQADSAEASVIARFVDIWTTFAKTGNPNCSEIKRLHWEAAGADDKPFKCLNLAEKAEIIDLPETKRVAFWDSLYKY